MESYLYVKVTCFCREEVLIEFILEIEMFLGICLERGRLEEY